MRILVCGGMKVLVCGGRSYNDKQRVYETLSAIHRKTPISVLIHGDAMGADYWGKRWARMHASKVKEAAFPADWERCGKAAGPLRNQEMLDAGPDLVVAFPGGKGTADMVRRARKAGVPVQIIGASVEPDKPAYTPADRRSGQI
jgi:predicted polyphosphate/ATP-dependent NAD kinase